MEKIYKYYYRFDSKDIKTIEKQMIDLDLNWSSLADKMKVSKAYLSAIKNGKKNVTEEFLDKIEKFGIKVCNWR